MEFLGRTLDAFRWQDLVPSAQAASRVVLIIALAWVAVSVIQRVVPRLRAYLRSHVGSTEDAKRIDTLSCVFHYAAVVVTCLLAGMLVLAEIGISIAPILGAAGVAGIAVGFGAQSLVKDFFVGLFILLENQVRQGDVVRIADRAGLVEEVTLRFVRLRDYDGHVHFVPNGLITTVENLSREFAYAVIDVPIASSDDIDRAFREMQHVGAEMRADPAFAARIVQDLELVGVEKWEGNAIVLRCRFKVAPLEQWAIRREFLRRLKHAFDLKAIDRGGPSLGHAREPLKSVAPPGAAA
jgi:small conductance mechanosensitive channel